VIAAIRSYVRSDQKNWDGVFTGGFVGVGTQKDVGSDKKAVREE